MTLAVAACHREPSGAAAQGGTAPAASRSAGGPSPRATDPLWVRARSNDPIEKTRLADAVGALGLVEGIDDGGETADVALAALAYADDGDLALGRLGRLALDGPAELRPRVLAAALAIAGRPRRPRELLDPDGVRACGEAMVAIANRQDLPREQRALAISAARALADKGYVDPARISGDLDPR